MRQIVQSTVFFLGRRVTKAAFDSTRAKFHELYRTDQRAELQTQPDRTEIHFGPTSVGEARDVDPAGLLPISSQPPRREPKTFRSAFGPYPVYSSNLLRPVFLDRDRSGSSLQPSKRIGRQRRLAALTPAGFGRTSRGSSPSRRRRPRWRAKDRRREPRRSRSPRACPPCPRRSSRRESRAAADGGDDERGRSDRPMAVAVVERLRIDDRGVRLSDAGGVLARTNERAAPIGQAIPLIQVFGLYLGQTRRTAGRR